LGNIVIPFLQRENCVSFGSTVSGRSNVKIPDVSQIVGLLINTIPVVINFQENAQIIDG